MSASRFVTAEGKPKFEMVPTALMVSMGYSVAEIGLYAYLKAQSTDPENLSTLIRFGGMSALRKFQMHTTLDATAKLLGTSRRSVTRLLGSFQSNGFLSFQSRRRDGVVITFPLLKNIPTIQRLAAERVPQSFEDKRRATLRNQAERIVEQDNQRPIAPKSLPQSETENSDSFSGVGDVSRGAAALISAQSYSKDQIKYSSDKAAALKKSETLPAGAGRQRTAVAVNPPGPASPVSERTAVAVPSDLRDDFAGIEPALASRIAAAQEKRERLLREGKVFDSGYRDIMSDDARHELRTAGGGDRCSIDEFVKAAHTTSDNKDLCQNPAFSAGFLILNTIRESADIAADASPHIAAAKVSEGIPHPGTSGALDSGSSRALPAGGLDAEASGFVQDGRIGHQAATRIVADQSRMQNECGASNDALGASIRAGVPARDPAGPKDCPGLENQDGLRPTKRAGNARVYP